MFSKYSNTISKIPDPRLSTIISDFKSPVSIANRPLVDDGYSIIHGSSSSLQPLLHDSTTPSHLAEKEVEPNNITIREQFFDLLFSLEHKFGESEPLLLKQKRPFLYSNEVSLTAPKTARRSKNGKSKNKKNNDMKELYKAFTASNPPPKPMTNLKGNRIYKITADVTGAAISTAANAGLSFTLAQLTNFANYTAVFDQYMITCIEIWLDGDSTIGVSGTMIQLASVTDYDDDSSSTNFNTLLGYQNVLVTNVSDSHYRKFIPHVAVATYSGSFISFGNASLQWIDSVSTTVQHYGVKFAVNSGTISRNYWARFHVSFRQSK